MIHFVWYSNCVSFKLSREMSQAGWAVAGMDYFTGFWRTRWSYRAVQTPTVREACSRHAFLLSR